MMCTFPSLLPRWCLLVLVLVAGAVHAEGSVDLHANMSSGLRAWLEDNDSGDAVYVGIPRKNSFEVYAVAGEVLALGSSMHGRGTGSDLGRIHYTSPGGTTTACPTNNATTREQGLIPNRAGEIAGPRYPNAQTSTTGGRYRACYVTVPSGQTGIWRVRFESRTGTSVNPSNNYGVGTDWASNQDNAGYTSLMAAWDITVFASISSSTKRSGRVWADYLPLNTGPNSANYANLNVYVLTREGYLFRQEQEIDPYGYIFFANNRGFLDSITGQPVFKSVYAASGAMQAGYDIHRPHQPDDANLVNVTHKLFLNQPDPSMPEEAPSWRGVTDWLKLPTPTLPPDLSDVRFTGIDGTDEQAAGVNGGGGVFHFTNPSSDPLSARIVIPLSANGVNVDRMLVGFAPPGPGTLVWDGLDGNGNPVHVGGLMEYEARAELLAAEVHFPFFDVERSRRLKIERLNGPPGLPGETRFLYWDHSLVAGTGQPAPLVNLFGLDSNTFPGMDFSTTTWGNEKGLDAWTYVPSQSGGIQAPLVVRMADLRIVKTADFEPVGRGGAVAWTLTVDNLSPDTYAFGVNVKDEFPSYISEVTWTCEIVEPGLLPANEISSCEVADGAGNIDTRVNLRTGAEAVFRIRGKVSLSAPNPIQNTATVSRAADAADPEMSNNTSTSVIVTAPGQAVSGRIYEDLEPNGQHGPGEDWVGGVPVWVTLIRDSGEIMDSQSVLAGTGLYSFAGVPDGSYQLVLTQENLSVLPMPPPGFQFTGPANGTLTAVTVAGANVTDQNFGLFRAIVIEGLVFEDNGAGAGVPHDGIRNGAEAGLAGVVIEARSGSTVVASTTTASDGTYALQLTGGGGSALDIVAQTPSGFISVSEHAGNSGASNTDVFDDTLRFTPVSGGRYTGLNFGDVRQPSLAADQIRTAVPGSLVFMPHVFTTYTAGSVVFSVPPATAVASPDIPGWDTLVFRDVNCNGAFDNGEPLVSGPVTVDLDTNAQICLLLRVFVPSGAPVNAQWQGVLQALMTYQHLPSLTSTRIVTDLVTVGQGESLVLHKHVDKTAALPGEVLVYTLTYRNAGSTPVSNVIIRDATPSFTVFVEHSATCVLPLPASITSCISHVHPIASAPGPVEWTLGGSLQSGAQGEVEYRVKVEQ